MKNISIIIVLLISLFSIACNKNDLVSTSISGQIRTNGTSDPIIISPELEKPTVLLLHSRFSSGGLLTGETNYDEIASVKTDEYGNFSFNIDLYEDDEYFLGYINVNPSIYFDNYLSADNWNRIAAYPITPGSNNSNMHLYASAYAWVQPRFINTNLDPNNMDVFDLLDGIGGPGPGVILDNFYGSTDTTMSWIHETWSGTQKCELTAGCLTHSVRAKLTRNGVTTEVNIPYNAPPFDTTVVEIRY